MADLPSPRYPLLRPVRPGGEIVGTGVAGTVEPECGDRRAIEEWLRSYATRSAHTERSARREIERFLMFLDVVKGPNNRHLPSVTTTDALNYQVFLTRPHDFPEIIAALGDGDVLARFGRTTPPFNFWSGKPGERKPSRLTATSRKIAITYLARMYRKLSHVRDADGAPYVTINPWEIVSEGKTFRPISITQALTKDEWSAVKQAIEAMPRDTDDRIAAYHRTRWTIQLLYRLWLRREEAASLRMASFVQTPDGWEVRFIGKGRKEAAISASDALMDELRVYRASLGLGPHPEFGEDRPAIGALRTSHDAPGTALRTGGTTQDERAHSISSLRDGVKPLTIYRICKHIFERAASILDPVDPAAAKRLRHASPHWMRHSGVTHALEGGVPDRYVQAHARHANRSMLDRYDHKDRRVGRNHINALKDRE